MKQLLIIGMAIILQWPMVAAHAAEPLSLAQALELADKSPKQQASDSAVDGAKARVSQAKSAFLPTVNLNQTYTRTNDPVSVFAAKLDQAKFTAADFAINTLNYPSSINNWVTRVEVKQPVIHSGVDVYKEKSAEKAYDAAKFLNQFEHLNLRLKVVTLYYTSVALREKCRVIDQGIRLLNGLIAGYEQAQAPTTANTSNYLVAKSNRTNLEALKIQTEAIEESSKKMLGALLNIPEGQTLVLTDPLPDSPKPISELHDATDTSMRSDVRAAEANAKSAAMERKAAKWGYGPNFDLFAAYNRYIGNFQDNRGTYEMGFTFSLPLFVGRQWGQVKEATSQSVMAENLYQSVTNDARADVDNGIVRYKASVEQYHLMQKAVKETSSALQTATKGYAEGSLPLLDYSQTIQNWTMVQQQLVDSRCNMAEAWATTQFNRGAL